MLEASRNENIEILSYSEVTKLEGYVGNYEVTVKKNSRYLDPELCNGCGLCVEVCPIYLSNYFDEHLSARKCIDIAFGQAVPFIYDIQKESCIE